MQNESQPVTKLVFKAGEVFLEAQGERKPIEEVVDTSSSQGAKIVGSFRSAASDYADLVNR